MNFAQQVNLSAIDNAMSSFGISVSGTINHLVFMTLLKSKFLHLYFKFELIRSGNMYTLDFPRKNYIPTTSFLKPRHVEWRNCHNFKMICHMYDALKAANLKHLISNWNQVSEILVNDHNVYANRRAIAAELRSHK